MGVLASHRVAGAFVVSLLIVACAGGDGGGSDLGDGTSDPDEEDVGVAEEAITVCTTCAGVGAPCPCGAPGGGIDCCTIGGQPSQCVSGTCAACGLGWQPCCGNGTCSGGNQCVGGTCQPCGGAWQPCCGGSSCSSGNQCVSGTCQPCGCAGQPACGGTQCGTCWGQRSTTKYWSSTCVACGGQWQSCCDNDPYNPCDGTDFVKVHLVGVCQNDTCYNHPGSCDGSCGGYAGGCWCDSACSYYGDCCSDYATYCGAPPPPPSGSCQGACGTFAGSCWCDSWCSYYGDCCSDKAQWCP